MALTGRSRTRGPALFLFLVAVAGSAASCSVRSQSIEWPDPLRSEPVGWYETEPGHKVLVTWAPAGDDLRLLDFDSASFSGLTSNGDGTFAWRGGGSPDREVTFPRAGNGSVRGLEWRDEEGQGGFFRRAEEFPFEQERVHFRNDSVKIAALLMAPRVRRYVGRIGERLEEVPVIVPGAVFIHGSGSSDRDNVWAFHIAQHLARSGVAVLLPDKRGSGGSNGDWRTADFDDLAGDAIAAAELLARHPTVDPERIGFVGLSQGGWIAPLAASRRSSTAFVIDVSGAAVTPGAQVRHEVEQDLRRAGLPGETIAGVLGLLERAMEYSRTRSDVHWRAYDSFRAELLRGPSAEAVDPFPAARDHWQWGWWHGVVDFDPIPYWRELEAPALVVYGAEDERDNVPVGTSIRLLNEALAPERNPWNELRVFAGSGHALADPATGWVRRDFLELLSDWLLKNVGAEVGTGG